MSKTVNLKEKLLLVDSPDVRFALTLHLEDAFQVTTAATTEEALNVIRSEVEIKILVTDIDLGGPLGHDGILVASVARAKMPDLPVLLVTGNPKSSPRIAAFLQLPGTAFVSKPFDPDEIEEAIRSLLKA